MIVTEIHPKHPTKTVDVNKRLYSEVRGTMFAVFNRQQMVQLLVFEGSQMVG